MQPPLSLIEAARRWGVSVAILLEAHRAGSLRIIRFSKRRRAIPWSEIQRVEEEGLYRSAPPTPQVTWGDATNALKGAAAKVRRPKRSTSRRELSGAVSGS